MPQRGGKTKKRGASRRRSQILTIPELRKSMEYISSYSENLVRSGAKSMKDLAKDFAKEWKRVFGKTLSPKIAESYVRHIMSMSRSKGMTRRKHRGGAMLTGAPLASLTRPGVDIPYGEFPKYVNAGFWNPSPAILADCGKQTGVLPSASVGTNAVGGMKGGGLGDLANQVMGALTFRPFVAQNPTSPQADLMTAWKGQTGGPGPESWQQAWQPKMSSAPLPPLTQVATYERDLTGDVKTR